MPGWDVHTHLIPPTVLTAAHRGEFGLSVDSGSLVIDGHRLPLKRLADPAALLQWIAGQGLDGAVVSVPPALFRYDAGLEWAELVNQGLRELATPQLRVLGQLPLHDPAAPEVAAALAREGVFSGFALGTTDYSGLDPVWQVLHELAAFTLIHPGHSDDKRLGSFYLSNLLGNPYETGLAAAALVFADVPGRFPGIRFCLCHGGGVTAAVAGRWQRGVDTSRPGVAPLSQSVPAALRSFYVDDLVHDDGVRELLDKTFGAEHVLAGSDWPFPMGSDAVAAERALAAGELTVPLAKEVTAG
ncbi:amidohydrolase family protein [Kribbella sandramycini]|uniref:Amidohydrolase family protein n=1 Tax=Kribbella sandramycini TaxID=60450 RepID=A0A7Y4L729_9ACTN|nr:amidohydrolase family protein [Kribbella sandramycini]MBB6568841.1 aminocarboxymuconate-semialdehyde decarboxylase [Kribbella sandramycini]NOL45610.1 amidohydrolase family protein [Kribbella sandramycini]